MDYFEYVLKIINRWAALGTRTVKSNGAKLVGQASHLGPEAWFHILFRGLDASGLAELEKHAGRSIPMTLQTFYSRSNGMILFSDSLAIYGLRQNYIREGDHIFQPYDIDTANVFERPKDAAQTILFIGSYSYDGSRLYTDALGGRVFRCARRTVAPLNEWATFEDMLVSECERLAGLFDNRGSMIDPTIPTTPTPR